MEPFVRGDIVVVEFPFNNVLGSKRRPALVLADWKGIDVLLCQITSKLGRDAYSIPVTSEDFSEGFLTYTSHVRVNQVFTLERTLISRRVGSLKREVTQAIVERLLKLLTK